MKNKILSLLKQPLAWLESRRIQGFAIAQGEHIQIDVMLKRAGYTQVNPVNYSNGQYRVTIQYADRDRFAFKVNPEDPSRMQPA